MIIIDDDDEHIHTVEKHGNFYQCVPLLRYVQASFTKEAGLLDIFT